MTNTPGPGVPDPVHDPATYEPTNPWGDPTAPPGPAGPPPEPERESETDDGHAQ